MLFWVLAIAACAPSLIMFLFYKKVAQPKPLPDCSAFDQEVRGSLILHEVVFQATLAHDASLASLPMPPSSWAVRTCFA